MIVLEAAPQREMSNSQFYFEFCFCFNLFKGQLSIKVGNLRRQARKIIVYTNQFIIGSESLGEYIRTIFVRVLHIGLMTCHKRTQKLTSRPYKSFFFFKHQMEPAGEAPRCSSNPPQVRCLATRIQNNQVAPVLVRILSLMILKIPNRKFLIRMKTMHRPQNLLDYFKIQ